MTPFVRLGVGGWGLGIKYKILKVKNRATFTSSRRRFVLSIIQRNCTARLRTTRPSNCIHILRNMRRITRLIFLLKDVNVKDNTSMFIRFFIVMVFCLLTSNYRRTIAFTSFVLSTTLNVRFLRFKRNIRFTTICLLLRFPITCGSNYNYRRNGNGRTGGRCPRKLPFLRGRIPLVRQAGVRVILCAAGWYFELRMNELLPPSTNVAYLRHDMGLL